MTIGQRLKARLAELDMKQSELAKKLNLSPTTLNGYFTGYREPDIETLKRLAKELEITVQDLIGSTEPPTLKEASDEEINRAFRVLDNQSVMIPVIGDVSAGLGVIAEEDIKAYMPAPSDLINPYNQYFYLEVQGDSMEPDIWAGDVVLVRRQSSVDSGELGVFLIDGEEGIVKRVKYDNDHIEFHSVNRYYPVRIFSGAEVKRVRVIGKVIFSSRRY